MGMLKKEEDLESSIFFIINSNIFKADYFCSSIVKLILEKWGKSDDYNCDNFNSRIAPLPP